MISVSHVLFTVIHSRRHPIDDPYPLLSNWVCDPYCQSPSKLMPWFFHFFLYIEKFYGDRDNIRKATLRSGTACNGDQVLLEYDSHNCH